MKLLSLFLAITSLTKSVVSAPVGGEKRPYSWTANITSPPEGSLLDEDESIFTATILKAYNTTSNLSVSVGNDKFTLQMGPVYGKKLLWKSTPEEEPVDLIGSGVGLYASYSGALHDLSYQDVRIVSYDSNKLDISFDAEEGEHHLVLFKGLDGIYSYFVNRGLPDLGEFRTLIRLNPDLYQNAHTSIKDGPLHVWPDDFQGEKIFDETWLNPEGGYVTKYDWSSRLHEEEIYGVYGSDNTTNKTYGAWLVSPGRDYFCGDQIKQELLVHRESRTGDVVLLNMLHGTHFEVEIVESFPEGKVWGPFLYYFNDGDLSDANRRLFKERQNWPYKWYENDKDYLNRGGVRGRLLLSDGAPASNVNLFLGETNNYTMVQGAGYQYYSYTDDDGYFKIDDVRIGKNYWLQAFSSEWSGGIDVIGNYTYHKEITVKNDKVTNLGEIKWKVDHETIWSIGNYDRTTKGFEYGAKVYEDFQTELCPGDYDFYVNETSYHEWCYAKSKPGTWNIHFDLDEVKSDKEAVLYISIAGYTGNNSYVGGESTKLKVLANGHQLERDTYETNLYNDKSTYRSTSFAGNWFYSRLEIPTEQLTEGENVIELVTEEYTPNYGIMWDSLKLVWE